MADAFIKGAVSVGHEVMKFETATKSINGCKACNTCFGKGVACFFKDDFNELAPLLEKADVIALATPLYWYSFPTQLKAAIDKLYAFIIGEKPLKIKESILMVCCEIEDENIFYGIVKSFEFIANDGKWIDRGRLIVPGVNNKGDIYNTVALEKAEKL